MADHESLGEIFAALELRAVSLRAYDGHTGGALVGKDGISEAADERLLGPHDDHVDLVADYEVADGGVVIRVERSVDAEARRARVARRDEEFIKRLALTELPGDGVFAAARADEENIQNLKY